jgi:hypothetical protein
VKLTAPLKLGSLRHAILAMKIENCKGFTFYSSPTL